MQREKEAEIILVEDNPHDIEMIIESLSDHNIDQKVQIFKNGSEVIDYFFSPRRGSDAMHSKLPRVIILDLKIPKINGLEILKRLKSDNRTRNIPVVIFSSSDEERDRVDSYRIGANSYIVKPLDSDEFASVVSEIGHYWFLINKPLDNP